MSAASPMIVRVVRTGPRPIPRAVKRIRLNEVKLLRLVTMSEKKIDYGEVVVPGEGGVVYGCVGARLGVPRLRLFTTRIPPMMITTATAMITPMIVQGIDAGCVVAAGALANTPNRLKWLTVPST